MAISTPVALAKGTSNSTIVPPAAWTSAALSPTVGGCFLAAVYVREEPGGAPAPNLSLAASAGTWSLAEYTVSNAASNRHTLSLWVDETPSYGASTTFAASADETGNRWGRLFLEVLGTTATVVQSKTGISTSATPSLTLDSPPDADNIVIAVCAAIQPGGGITPGSGFTEIDDTGTANLTALQAQWRTGSTSQTVAWADCGTNGSLMIAVEIEAAAVASPRKLRARSANTADTSFTAEINLGDLAAGRMYAGIATFDATGNQVGLYLHDGTSDTEAATGTMATQTGDLALGNSYASSAVITQTIEAKVGPRIATFETVLDAAARGIALGRLADEVAPRAADYALDISGLASTSVDLSGVVQDPTGWGWSITSAAPLDEGHWISPLAPNAKSFTVNPNGPAGTTAALITVTNAFGLYPRSASLTVTMTKVADDSTVGSWPWLLYPLPTGLPTVTVSDRASLDSEIASAGASGKRIVVTGTLTGGTLTISKVMSRAKPLIIEAATRLGATLNFQVTVTGQYVALRNLLTQTIVFQGAKYCTAFHCKAIFDGGWTHGRAVYFTNSALFCAAWGCETRATSWPSGNRPSDNIRRNLIFWDGNGWNGQPKWCFAFYCYGPDAPARPDPTNYSSGSVAAFIFGDDVSISHVPTNNGMYRSLLSAPKGGHGQIETKMSKVWVIESGIIDGKSVNGGGNANINNRQGHGSEFIRDFNLRGGGFEIHRAMHRLVAPSTDLGRILIVAGTGDYYNFAVVGQNNTFCPADQVRVIRPVGTTVVGEDYNAGSGNSTLRPVAARATQIEGAVAGSVTLDYQTATNQSYISGDLTTAAAVELAPSQVGLNAPEGDSLSGMPAEMWQFSAWIDWTKNWQHYKTTGNASSVVQTDTGFEVKAGPNASTEGTIYVFSRYTVPYDNVQVDFDFTRTDGGGGTGAGEAFLFHFGARGKGTALTPTDLSTLDYAAFRVIENEMFAYRWSFGQDSGVSNDDQMRLRIFRADGTAGEQIISTTPTVYPFPQGIPHRFHFFKRGTYVRNTITRLDNRVVQMVEATDPRLAELTGGGHLGIRCMPGRSGRFESIKITRF